ncbi:MAG TPA: porin [Gammaproteobacteria bacterium]|nr:porin [Gammaproteobacteria bacterium]
MNRVVAGAIAVVLVGTPVLCQADLTLYGRVYAEAAKETSGKGATKLDTTTLDDEQNAGRIGLKFSQKLDHGLSAFGKYEFNMNAPDATDNFTARESYVGIEGGFGSVAAGRFSGVYKTLGGTDFDPFIYTSLEARGYGGMSGSAFGTSGYIGRAVQYQSPVFGKDDGMHVRGAVQYGMDSTPGVTDADRGSYLAGLSFGYGIAELVAAVSHDKARDKSNTKLGARIRSGDITWVVQSENVEEGGFDTAGAGTFLFGGVEYRNGDLNYVAQVGSYRSDAASSNGSYFALGVQYFFAKNIWVTAGYRNTQSDVDSLNSSALVAGLNFSF